MTLANLRSDARFLIFGDSTSTTYGDTDLDRNLNNWYRRCIAWILTVNGGWQVNGEIATASLAANQREYILPTDILKINSVYIKYDTDGDYIKAIQRDPRNIYEYPEDYNPIYPEFDLLDNSLFVYLPNTSIVAITDGLKIHYQTDITALSNTTDTPNLAEPFENLLSLGAAYDYALAKEMYGKVNALKVDIADKKAELLEFYAQRSTAKRPSLEMADENY